MEQYLNYFEPTNYSIAFDIDKENESFVGQTIVTGIPKSQTFYLHAVGMEIDAIAAEAANSDTKVTFDYDYDGEKITITLSEEDFKTYGADGADSIQFCINYHRPLNKNMEGAYLSTYEYEGKTEKIVTTQFESHYAREAFPCVDEPAAKATFGIIITVPEGSKDLILANTPVKSVVKNTTTFETTPRMSTYLVAFVIGRFHGKTIKNAHGVTITTYAALNQSLDSVDFANEVAAKSLEYYDDEFGIKYPLEKLDQVALPDFEAGAMENWGLVTYRESMLLADKTATISTKKSVALTVAHELSHQWFGDLVTMKWWDDLWLNESFASIMEYLAVDANYPEFQIWENFFTQDCLMALRRDAYRDVQSVHQDVHNPAEIATLFDGAIVYSKGARLMLMLIRAMGWENFKKGINDYFVKYAYKNTIGDNLWDALTPYADFDVKTFMHAWIDNPGYPVLTGDTQQRFLLDGPLKTSKWPIPHVLDDMSGHYALNLSDDEFAAKIASFDSLGLEEKLRLLIDRSLLSKTPLCASDSLLDLIAKFKHEDSAAVWDIIATIISNLKIFFDADSAEEKAFKKFVLDLVSEKLTEVGIVTRPDDDENTIRLRAVLLALDHYAEDKPNLEKLAALYDDDIAALDPEIRSDILDAKIYVEPSIIDTYIEKYQTLADPELKFDLLFASTLSKTVENLEKMIALLEKPEIVKPQDQFHLFIYLYRNPKSRNETFDWLTKHWDYVKNLSGDKSLDNYPRYIANVVRRPAEAEAYFKFFDQHQDEPALKRALKIAKNEINSRLQLIDTDMDGILNKIKK